MPEQSDAAAWLRFAQQDLTAARVLLANARSRPVGLLPMPNKRPTSQLKAHPVRLGIAFRRTHDLAVLAALQPADVQEQLAVVDLQVLQQWAVEARYPAELPEAEAMPQRPWRSPRQFSTSCWRRSRPEPRTELPALVKKPHRRCVLAYQICIGLIHLHPCSPVAARAGG